MCKQFLNNERSNLIIIRYEKLYKNLSYHNWYNNELICSGLKSEKKNNPLYKMHLIEMKTDIWANSSFPMVTTFHKSFRLILQDLLFTRPTCNCCAHKNRLFLLRIRFNDFMPCSMCLVLFYMRVTHTH